MASKRTFSGFDPALFPENTPRNSALSKWDLVSESPTGGGVECACLLAFAYSDHNRSLIVFANEHDNYELVKLLILNTRVYWNYSGSLERPRALCSEPFS